MEKGRHSGVGENTMTQTTKKTPEQIADYWSDWLIDAVGGATQDYQFVRNQPKENQVATEAIEANGRHAILMALKEAGYV
jgi:hypothetical protein